VKPVEPHGPSCLPYHSATRHISQRCAGHRTIGARSKPARYWGTEMTRGTGQTKAHCGAAGRGPTLPAAGPPGQTRPSPPCGAADQSCGAADQFWATGSPVAGPAGRDAARRRRGAGAPTEISAADAEWLPAGLFEATDTDGSEIGCGSAIAGDPRSPDPLSVRDGSLPLPGSVETAAALPRPFAAWRLRGAGGLVTGSVPAPPAFSLCGTLGLPSTSAPPLMSALLLESAPLSKSAPRFESALRVGSAPPMESAPPVASAATSPPTGLSGPPA